MKNIIKLLIINSSIGALGVNASEVHAPKNYSLKKLSTNRESTFVAPAFKNEEETISLIQALLQSEKEFWETSKQKLLDSDKKLAVIVSILNKDENRSDLSLRWKLFAAKDKKSEREAYTAHKNLVYLIQILGNLETCLIQSWEKSHSLEETLASFVTNVKKENKDHQKLRQLFTHSAVPEMNKQLKNNRFDIQDYKNLEIVTSGFAGLLIKILQNHHKEAENIKKTALEIRVEKNNSCKKRRVMKDISFLTPQSEKVSVQDIDSLTAHTVEWGESLESTMLNLILEPESDVAYIFVPSNAKDIVRLDNMPFSQETFEGKEDGTEKVMEDNVDEEYDLQPWKKYQDESAQLTSEVLFPKVERPQLAITLLLEDDHWTTIETLLKLNKNTNRSTVSMKSFIKVITTLKGNVIRGKKNVHFAIPNIFNGKMVAVPMHALHGDNATQLPKDTYYWERAVTLLERAGFCEYLQGIKK
jgi:hypothetical protein